MKTLKILLSVYLMLLIGLQGLSQNNKSMNVEVKGIRTVIYKVPNIEDATRWYSTCLGKKPYFEESFYVGFNIGGYELGLLPDKSQEPKTTNVLAYWSVDDITDSYDKMVSKGATELEAPNDVGDGVKVALIKDPWQNVIGLINNPHFKESYGQNAIIEWAPYKLKKEVSLDKLHDISEKLEKGFLIRQKGFIRRELLQKSEIEWVDLLYWETKKDAWAAFENAQTSEEATAYFSLMDMSDGEPKVQHLKIQSD